MANQAEISQEQHPNWQGQPQPYPCDSPFFRYLPAAIAWVNCQMQILAVTERWLQDYDWETQDMVGECYEQLPIVFPPGWQKIKAECLAGKTVTNTVQPWSKIDGTIDWWRWDICPWYDRNGEIGGLAIHTTLISSTNVTPMSDSAPRVVTPEPESVLDKERSLLEAILRFMPVGAIVAAAPSGRLIWRNQQAKEIFGDRLMETTNLKNDAEWRGFHADGTAYELAQWPIVRSITIGEVIKAEEITIDYNDHISRVLLMSSAPIRNLDGTIIGGVSMFWDITDRIQVEQKIRNINQDLEQRVQERTAQLEATNRELEAFSYSVSHDLRAPLRGIDGFSQALLMFYQDRLDERAKHYLGRIRANSLRMGELIDDLLGLSRLTRTQMQRTQVDLSAIAAEIITDLCHTHPERSVQFINTPGLIANGDARLLRIVLENLLNNAWKYTCREPKAKISFGVMENTNAKVTYFVQDNGAGFDMAYAHKLFGAFQRLHSEDEFPGTGIGLATVKRIIHKHGGHVWAESAINQGATFFFTLY
jgi:signal transduction histidine kinase